MRSPPPSDRLIITVKLPEGAFQLARTSPNITLPATILAKIQATPIDLSRGNDQLCRQARLTLAEAKVVHEYYRRSADAFARIRDSARALMCAKARASVRQELWSRRRGP